MTSLPRGEASDTVVRCPVPGYVIVRRVTRYAYPRNGNTHNPTPTHQWTVYGPEGRRIGIAPRYRTAVEIAQEDNQ